jgi:5-methylcytosine-specific restriction protein A
MTKRKPLTRLQRTKLLEEHKETCCLCHFKIDTSKIWIVEHIKPLWLGGEDDKRNMGPAHEHCARKKTSAEAPVKAKSDRVRANYLGVPKSRRRPMRGSRDHPLQEKRKIDGTVVRRTQSTR